jgi:hypothetical protein
LKKILFFFTQAAQTVIEQFLVSRNCRGYLELNDNCSHLVGECKGPTFWEDPSCLCKSYLGFGEPPSNKVMA